MTVGSDNLIDKAPQFCQWREEQSLPEEVRQHISAEAVAMLPTPAVATIPAEAAVGEPGAKSGREFRYGHEAIGIALREGGTKALFRCAGTFLLFPPLTKLWSFIYKAVSYTHLTLPTTLHECRSRWSTYH